MKICLVAHGYPPELVGGTEVSVQNLARALVARGHEVVVVAGSMQHEKGFRLTEARDGDVRVRRIHRADLYFDHWQKSASARVAEAFARILREERPALVHVHHWIRLTRELVFLAASEEIPAVVTLHDLWTTCLVTFRVRPDTKQFCEATLGPDPCLACAGQLPPKTPWVTLENQFMALAEHKGDLLRELKLARAVVVPGAAHARAVQGFLGIESEALNLQVVPHGRDLDLKRSETRTPRSGRGLVLGAWGHLHPLKGQDLLLDAISRLRDPNAVELHLAGGEPDAQFAADLRARARNLRVHFHGSYDVAELGQHPVTDVDAMLSGTRAHESWGLVIDEAVALRLPMLLPRSGAYADRLQEGQGALFFEPRDAASLSALLQRLLDEPGLLSSTAGALPSLERVAPSIESHVDALLGVYRDVLSAGPPGRPAVDWWAAKMRQAAESAWDTSLSQRSAEELGFS